MPAFAGDQENDVSVRTHAASGPLVFGKGVRPTVTSRPVVGLLGSVDANVPVHGRCVEEQPYPKQVNQHTNYPTTPRPKQRHQPTQKQPPPPPSFPPPSPPPTLTDGHFYRRSPCSSHAASSSDLSASSSADMTGHGGDSTSGGPASSHATTVPPDDELVCQPARPPSSSSATSLALSMTQPSRPPPAPPTTCSPNHIRASRSPSRPPPPPPIDLAPPSHPPPPPPKEDALAGRRPPAMHTPISVPSPLVDRTRTAIHTPIRGSTTSTVGSSILTPLAPGRADGTAMPTSASAASLSTHGPPAHSPVPPHRFSSPPAYIPGGSAAAGPSSGVFAPPKHRHTLEVPRATPARNSRDGLDASGRFSPTAAGSISGSVGGRRPSLNLVRRNTRSMQSDGPRDEIVPDEDALRWTEAYRQKRASKKRRLEQDDNEVLVGTKVDETHANWVAAYNMLTGIRVSVSRTNAKLDRPLTDEDFEAKQKSTFDIAGNELVPSAKYDFKFKDYAPWVFRRLRALFHLDPADYLMSLAGKYILSELGSPGKSGSFFYFSRDYKYIIKTIHHAEHKFLRKILKEYYQHVMDNPNTLLSQFYGLHRVKMPYGRKIHFVVMNNLFPPHRDIHQTFDLKGSTVGRNYPEERVADNPRATLKDLNWLRRQERLELGMVKKRLFLDQLHKDVALLQRLQIMDYSLLVGIHDIRRGNDENLRGQTLQVFEPGADSASPDGPEPSVLLRTPSRLENQRKTRELRQMLKAERPIPIGQSANKMPDEADNSKQSIFYQDNGGFQATRQNNSPADEVYYLGVIDCLTHYGMVKKIEHFWKGLSHDRNEISALPPQQYGDRFLKFVSSVTMSPEEAAHERAALAETAAAAAAATAAAEAAATAALDDAHGASSSTSREHGSANGTANGTAHGNAHGGTADTLAVASGRDKGKEAAHSAWSGTLRHRGVSRADEGETSLAIATDGPTDRRESVQLPVLPVLPILEEAGEASLAGSERSETHEAHEAHDVHDAHNVHNAHNTDTSHAADHCAPPALKPDSADSGYGVSGTRSRSGTVGSAHKAGMLSRESLDKALPPLPQDSVA